MKQSKRRLTANEEFEVMKLVLDKFLWLGFGIMAWGLLQPALYPDKPGTVQNMVYYLVMGAVVLLLFMVIVVKEYEFVRY